MTAVVAYNLPHFTQLISIAPGTTSKVETLLAVSLQVSELPKANKHDPLVTFNSGAGGEYPALEQPLS